MVSGAHLAAPTVLIMDSPGRLVRTRRDRDRAGSGGKRAADTEADIVVPVVGGVPVAVRGAEVLGMLFQDPPRKTRRQGAVQASRVMAESNRPPRKIVCAKIGRVIAAS